MTVPTDSIARSRSATEIPEQVGTRLLAESAGKLKEVARLLYEAAGHVPADRGRTIQRLAQWADTAHQILRRIVHSCRGGHRA